MRIPRVVPAVLVVASISLLGGCSTISNFLGGASEPTRDEASGEITEASSADVFALAVGDCLDDEGSDEVTSVPVVPCGDPHDFEVYHEFSIDGTEWPGEDAIFEAADAGCYEQFEPFVGFVYEESEIDFNYYSPTQQSWEDGGDRLVSCLVYDMSGKTTGTLAGAAR